MILELVHQPKSKEFTYNHTNIQVQNTKTHQMCTHKKLAKQQNNVLKSQITKRNFKSHNKGFNPKSKKVRTYSH
jgi:hypothetical protein